MGPFCIVMVNGAFFVDEFTTTTSMLRATRFLNAETARQHMAKNEVAEFSVFMVCDMTNGTSSLDWLTYSYGNTKMTICKDCQELTPEELVPTSYTGRVSITFEFYTEQLSSGGWEACIKGCHSVSARGPTPLEALAALKLRVQDQVTNRKLYLSVSP